MKATVKRVAIPEGTKVHSILTGDLIATALHDMCVGDYINQTDWVYEGKSPVYGDIIAVEIEAVVQALGRQDD